MECDFLKESLYEFRSLLPGKKCFHWKTIKKKKKGNGYRKCQALKRMTSFLTYIMNKISQTMYLMPRTSKKYMHYFSSSIFRYNFSICFKKLASHLYIHSNLCILILGVWLVIRSWIFGPFAVCFLRRNFYRSLFMGFAE